LREERASSARTVKEGRRSVSAGWVVELWKEKREGILTILGVSFAELRTADDAQYEACDEQDE
jgi:hypothetical protein